MNNREKEIIEAVKLDIKKFQENCNNIDIVSFLDCIIILGKEFNYSVEFMERLYFLRYYHNLFQYRGNEKMRNYENQRLQATIEGIKYMQKMKFDKYVILNNLDSMIENLRVNASNDFINCIFDIRQKVVLDKEIK